MIGGQEALDRLMQRVPFVDKEFFRHLQANTVVLVSVSYKVLYAKRCKNVKFDLILSNYALLSKCCHQDVITRFLVNLSFIDAQINAGVIRLMLCFHLPLF